MTGQNSNKLYQVVFAGELQPGADLATVKLAVAKIFKVNDEQIARFFSGKRIVVKSDVDAVTAKKYRDAFEKAGARCRIGEMPSVDSKAAIPSRSSPVVPASPKQTASNQDTQPSTPKPSSGESSADTTKRKPTIRMAPMGAKLAPQKRIQSSPDMDLSHLDMMPVGSRLEGERDEEEQQAPAVDHISMAPVGERLTEKQEEIEPDDLNLDYISIAPEGTILGNEAEEVELADPVELDHLSMAPVGARLEDERDDSAVTPPDISHLSMETRDHDQSS